MGSFSAAQTSLARHDSARAAQERPMATRRSTYRQHRKFTACIAAVSLALALLLADGAHSALEQPSSRGNTSAAMLFNMQTGDADTLPHS
jgi:hypothetical protein